MNKYLDYYNRSNLESIEINRLASKALKYGSAAIVLGLVGCLLAPLANLNVYSVGNLLLGLIIGIIILGICLNSFFRLKNLHGAQQNLLGNVEEIEKKLFDENGVLPEKTLIGITKEKQLFIMGQNLQGAFFAYVATKSYLHYSPVIMTETQIIDFEKVVSGDKNFFELKESF
jgi:hypothetical protein